FAVRLDGRERVKASPTDSDHEFADATHVGHLTRRLAREAPGVVLVPYEDHVGPRGIEIAPEGVVRRVISMLTARRETGVMPVRERAGRLCRREVGFSPLFL